MYTINIFTVKVLFTLHLYIISQILLLDRVVYTNIIITFTVSWSVQRKSVVLRYIYTSSRQPKWEPVFLKKN